MLCGLSVEVQKLAWVAVLANPREEVPRTWAAVGNVSRLPKQVAGRRVEYAATGETVIMHSQSMRLDPARVKMFLVALYIYLCYPVEV